MDDYDKTVTVIKYNGLALDYRNSRYEIVDNLIYVYERHEFEFDDVMEIAETLKTRKRE